MDTLITYHCNIDSIRDYLNLYFFLVKNIDSKSFFKIIIKGQKKRKLIEKNNYTYIYINNLNNYDIGGYSLAINHTLINDYKYFIFVNSSVIGPIERKANTWIDKYKALLSDNVAIAGSSIFVMDEDYFKSINLECFMKFPYSHVQTYSFILKKNSLEKLKDHGFFELENQDKNKLILNFEIAISQYLLNQNYNIACLLDGYDFDYRLLKKNPNPTSRNGDALYKNAYFGGTVNPLDAVFIKTNRKLMSLVRKTFLITSQLREIGVKKEIGFLFQLSIKEFVNVTITNFNKLLNYIKK